MNARRRLSAVFAAVCVPLVVAAPRVVAQRCNVPADAPWAKKQMEWLDESKHPWTNDSLRAVLLTAAQLDPKTLGAQRGVIVEGRGAPPSAEMAAVIAQLRRGGRGGPPVTRTAIGPAGTRAFFMLALADTGYLNSAMHRLMEAGPDESLAADVAVLEDLSRLRAGRKQIYGTQFRVDGRGNVALAPMEDSAHADLRREEANLPPLALGLCLARMPASKP